MESAELVRPNGSLVGAIPRGQARSNRFERGRVCSFEGCPTRLSSYNPADRCWTHTETHPVIGLGRRPREAEGPRVLSEVEEEGLIRAVLGKSAGPIRRGRHRESGSTREPTGPPTPPQPFPQPDQPEPIRPDPVPQPEPLPQREPMR
jgi:hypothetical protein